MRIEEVRTEPQLSDGLASLLVHVRSSEDLVGTGECWWGVAATGTQPDDAPVRATATVVDTILTPLCVGRDPRRIDEIWASLSDFTYRWGDGGMMMCALSGIDLALWDLAGKRHGVPVLDLLGGPVHESLSAYASLPPLRSRDRLSTEIERVRAAGYTAVKLHEVDTDLIKHGFEAAGSDLGVMVDVNGHYDFDEAKRVGRMLGELGAVWFEEPIHPMRDIESLAALRRELPVAVAAGENEWSVLDTQRLLQAGAVDYFQPEVTKIGGLTPGQTQSALAEHHGVAFCPHNFRAGPSLAASVHWAFSSPAARWLEIRWLPEGVERPAGWDLPAVADGRVAPPTRPGLSMA